MVCQPSPVLFFLMSMLHVFPMHQTESYKEKKRTREKIKQNDNVGKKNNGIWFFLGVMCINWQSREGVNKTVSELFKRLEISLTRKERVKGQRERDFSAFAPLFSFGIHLDFTRFPVPILLVIFFLHCTNGFDLNCLIVGVVDELYVSCGRLR